MNALRRAWSKSARLGHQWVGPQHILLAILRDSSTTACRVLNELGLDYAIGETEFATSLLNGSPPIRSDVSKRDTRSPAPIYYSIEGWISGYSAAHGVGVTDEVALLALCWKLSYPLARGIARQRVVEALQVAGVAVPHQPLPADDSADEVRIDVPIERLAEFRRKLLDAGLLVGFNSDRENEQAWVLVRSANVDAARRLLDAAD